MPSQSWSWQLPRDVSLGLFRPRCARAKPNGVSLVTMKMSVIGCGYLGAVHAACMAKLGHDVVGVDIDQKKIDDLSQGKAPFYEPGFPEVLEEAMPTGRLRFTTDMSEVAGAEAHFVCVGTPQRPNEFAADLTYVDAAVEGLLPHLDKKSVVIGKSTVPVGTAERLAAWIHAEAPAGEDVTLAWNPEFLREGFAVQDTLHPDRFVYGVPSGPAGEYATQVMNEVYAEPLSDGTPLVVTDYATAQMVKTAANSFLATKISFINAMAELCEASGADVVQLADAIGYDERIGRKFLGAGLGFGGGCLPKDIRAFMARAGELGAHQALTFLREVDAINMRRRNRMVEMARNLFNGSLIGVKTAVLGATFKPNSDDVRDSPALNVAGQLKLQGAQVIVTDPQGCDNARRAFPDLTVTEDLKEAVTGAELIILGTEWQEYQDLDPATIKGGDRKFVLDGRNALDVKKWQGAGWSYHALGRPGV